MSAACRDRTNAVYESRSSASADTGPLRVTSPPLLTPADARVWRQVGSSGCRTASLASLSYGTDGVPPSQGAVVVDYRIELVILPVSDVDRARAFYGDQLGWPVDHDQTVSDELRFVQVTPPGSACSIAFGRGLSTMEPGSLRAKATEQA